jgi:acetoin:2,6-dichlorophenolindophenol oxidoreductase subunit beta
MNKKTFADSVNDALHVALEIDEKVLCYGLGVDDPKRVFGTTANLVEKFGKRRVFDFPTSENAMTGVAIGAALNGYRSVIVHQRLDFFLLALDQLVNSAAKWHYMFGGKNTVPITIRLIIGRGWGQGPTHSQSLQSWFAHIPGLRVIMPSTAADAKGLLLSSIFDENPVVFIEHRWLHHQVGDVQKGDYRISLDKAHVVQRGEDVTIVASSFMVVEAIRAIKFLKNAGISCELIDLRSLNPIDWPTIFDSVSKTGRIVALDTAAQTISVSSEIIARVSIDRFSELKSAPGRVALPDIPIPTSPALTKGLYPGAADIAEAVLKTMGKELDASELRNSNLPDDIPGSWFTGPF